MSLHMTSSWLVPETYALSFNSWERDRSRYCSNSNMRFIQINLRQQKLPWGDFSSLFAHTHRNYLYAATLSIDKMPPWRVTQRMNYVSVLPVEKYSLLSLSPSGSWNMEFKEVRLERFITKTLCFSKCKTKMKMS